MSINIEESTKELRCYISDTKELNVEITSREIKTHVS
jgi:hypothetical protein